MPVGVNSFLRLHRLCFNPSLLVSYIDLLRHQLRIDEGVRRFPYTDVMGKLTIGCGRNLADTGVSDDEIALMLENDIRAAEKTAHYLLPDFDSLSDVRKYVMCNLAFNLGQQKLSEFSKLLLAVHEERWADAAMEILDSRYAQQVGARAIRLSNAMRDDTL